MNEYKGIYYGNSSKLHFYEGGANFKYIDLYNKLENLYKEQSLIQPLNQVNFFNYCQLNKTRNKTSNLIQSKTGNESTFSNLTFRENLTQLPLSKFILSKHLKMNLSIYKNKHLNLDNLIYEKNDTEKKSDYSHSKENSIHLKNQSSISKNIKNQYIKKSNKNNPQNIIIKYNPIMTKKKRNVSLNLENNSNKQLRNNNKKISNIQKNKRIDLSDKENSIRKLNNYENKNNSKDKNCVSYIQSKTQRAREYSMIVKKNNMVNNINHNSSNSKSKSISKSKKKIKGRSNSNISIIKPHLFGDFSCFVKKNNLKKEKNKKGIEQKISKEKINLNKYFNNKKSRNIKKDNMLFKSSSIDNNKKNILSSSISTNVKTVYEPKNKTYKIINNQQNCHKNSNNFINNHINDTIGSNYTQLYLKKNRNKNPIENNNFFLNSKTFTTHKPLVTSRLNKGKINSYNNQFIYFFK